MQLVKAMHAFSTKFTTDLAIQSCLAVVFHNVLRYLVEPTVIRVSSVDEVAMANIGIRI